MSNALIGYTGFVGTTLLKQSSFASLFRSTNIAEIEGQAFDTVVCAGAPAQKWIANRDPEQDAARIQGLIGHLRTIRCKRFILISTVDVFKSPVGVDEDSVVDTSGLHAYGLNRRILEQFVEHHFAEHVIVRLPGLVGPGLRKNVIYDLLNDNDVHKIESRSVFQFYPTANLWYDIDIVVANKLRLVHLTSSPVSVADVARQGFGIALDNRLEAPPATYDMRTRHAMLFGGSGAYQYSARETIQAVRMYAQSEPRKAKA
jgi:dTDP-4-dehydrorhamnose reductase